VGSPKAQTLFRLVGAEMLRDSDDTIGRRVALYGANLTSPHKPISFSA